MTADVVRLLAQLTPWSTHPLGILVAVLTGLCAVAFGIERLLKLGCRVVRAAGELVATAVTTWRDTQSVLGKRHGR